MAGKGKGWALIFFFLFTVFSCLAFTAPYFTRSVSALALDAKPDSQGNYDYLIPGCGYAAPHYTSHKLWPGGDTPDFIFRRGFSLKWESVSGSLEAADYEISFLTASGEGLIINQKKSDLSISVLASDSGSVHAGNTYSGTIASKETDFSFGAQRQSFIFSVNGEIIAERPLDTFAAAENETAALIFINKSMFMTDSVKIVSLCQGNEPYGGGSIEEPEDKDEPKDKEEPEDKDEPKDKEESEDKGESKDKEEPEDKGEPEDKDKPQDKDEPELLTVVFNENNEYKIGSGVDLIIPVKSSGAVNIIIKRENRELLGQQGVIAEGLITLKADYLESIYTLEANGGLQCNARFNVFVISDSGETVEKTLYVTITKAAVLPEEPNEPSEEPDEPSEPGEPSEEPIEPPGEPDDDPDKNPDEELSGEPEDPPANPDGNDTDTPPPGKGGHAPNASDEENIGVGDGGKKDPDITLPAVFALGGGSLLVMSAPLFVLSLRKKNICDR